MSSKVKVPQVITVRDTPPYGHAPTYQISLTYLERQKSYGSDKLRWEETEEEEEAEAEEKIRLKHYGKQKNSCPVCVWYSSIKSDNLETTKMKIIKVSNN